MARNRTPYQVADILKSLNGIGESKKENREQGNLKSLESKHFISNKIHSYRSLEQTRIQLKSLGNYAKETFKINHLNKINIIIITSWINSKNLSYRSASNYLSIINKVYTYLDVKQEEIKLLRNTIRPIFKKPEFNTRAYKNLKKIILSPQNQIAFELQRDYGLRFNASSNINIKNLKNNTLNYQEKGGKWSEKELSTNLADRIRNNAINGKYAIAIYEYSKELKIALNNIGEIYNGTHGIRHSYAQDMLEKGFSKQEVSEAMGHRRKDIVNVYLR